MKDINNERERIVILRDFMKTDLGLSGNELNLYAVIHSLTEKYGYCRASREYFAERISASRASVGRAMKKLRDSGLIERLDGNGRLGEVAELRAVPLESVKERLGNSEDHRASDCEPRRGSFRVYRGSFRASSRLDSSLNKKDYNNHIINTTTTTTTYNAGGEESEFYHVEFLGDKNEPPSEASSYDAKSASEAADMLEIKSDGNAEAESQHSRDGKKDEELTESEQDALREAREADALRKLIIAYENGDKSALRKWRDVVEEFEGVRPPKDLLSDKANASSLREVLTKLNKSCGAAGGAGAVAKSKSSDSMKITWGRGADAFEFDLEEYYRSRGGYDSSVEAKLLELGEYKVVKMTHAQFDELVFKLGLEVVDEYVLRLERFLLSNKCAGVFSHFETIKKWVNEDLNVNV